MKRIKHAKKIGSFLLAVSLLFSSVPEIGRAESLTVETEATGENAEAPAAEEQSGGTQAQEKEPQSGNEGGNTEASAAEKQNDGAGQKSGDTEAAEQKSGDTEASAAEAQGGDTKAPAAEPQQETQDTPEASGGQPAGENTGESAGEEDGMQPAGETDGAQSGQKAGEEQEQKTKLSIEPEKRNQSLRQGKEAAVPADTGERKPEVIEVSDLSSLANAVKLATAGDDLGAAELAKSDAEGISLFAAKEDQAFAAKRLIVRSEEGFDPCGAVSIIQGYGSLFILTYDTEEQTKTAYESLRAVPYLSVEPDVLISVQAGETPKIFESADTKKVSLEEFAAMAAESGRETKACEAAAEDVSSFLHPEAQHTHARDARTQGTAENDALKLPDAGQAAVLAAVLDTGFDFAGTAGERILDGADFSGSGTAQDENGHGTAMADIIRRGTDDRVSILPVKITDAGGRSTALKLYLGMEYALAAGADVVNVSMSAYKPAGGSLIAEEVAKLKNQGVYVVAAAGNYGEDTVNYVPANVEDAIVVSAINANAEADGYSNHGSTVDYCAYGSVTAAAPGGSETAVSGTSVSAAIVTAVIAGKKAKDGGIPREAMLAELDAEAEDLGDTGKDPVYGMGALYAEGITPEGEGEWEGIGCELLSCDWKNLTDEELNARIDAADEIYQKRFLDGLSEAEREELLAREDILYNHAHTAAAYDVEAGTGESGEKERFQGTLKDYLSSGFFEEYVIQAEKDYGKYNGNQPYWAASLTGGVKVTTDQGGDYGKTVTVHFKQQGGQPTDKYTVTVSATNAGAFDFSDMGVCGRFLTGDDNGHNLGTTPVPMAAFVNGITVKKNAHSKVSGQSRTLGQTTTRLVVGGFYSPKSSTITDGNYKKYTDHISASYGSNACGASATANVGLMISIFEAKPDEDQTFTLNFLQHTISDSYGDWIVTQNPTCTGTGFKARTKSSVCNGCKGVVKTETQTEAIAALGHVFDHYGYMADNGIANGKRWLECGRYCIEPGWQKDVQYLQQIYYRYMDADGNYPGYSEHLNQYCDAGSVVPGWNYAETADGEFLSASGGVGNYYANNANVVYINVPRKQYSVVYDANGGSGSMGGQTVYCGKTFLLAKNQFKRKGYRFIGWGTSKSGPAVHGDQQEVKNLSMANGGKVTLYAQWEAVQYKITLDEKRNLERYDVDITAVDRAFYEWHEIRFYRDDPERGITKVTVPKIGRAADFDISMQSPESLTDKRREYRFDGYYLGDKQIVGADGKINVPNTYFEKDTTLKAEWTKKYMIYYDMNLNPTMEAAGIKGEMIRVPERKFYTSQEPFMFAGKPAEIQDEFGARICKFVGWNTQADGSGTWYKEAQYTASLTEDIYLFAQWEISYDVSYIGNEQTEGFDFTDDNGGEDYVADPENMLTLDDNTDDDGKNHFKRTAENTFVSPRKGDTVTQKVECSVIGWSFKNDNNKNDLIPLGEEQATDDFMVDAKNNSAFTFGAPNADFGSSNPEELDPENERKGAGSLFPRLGDGKEETVTPEQMAKGANAEEDKAYANLYAVWDKGPVIDAQEDLYYTLNEARHGMITVDDLLNYAVAWDAELQEENPESEGLLKKGRDPVNQTEFTVQFRQIQFRVLTGDASMTVTFVAKDSAGNVTKKKVWVHVVDTRPRDVENVHDNIRFISKEHFDTLAPNSIWRKEPYRTELWNAVCNVETGKDPVYHFYFKNEQIMALKQWVIEHGVCTDLDYTWKTFCEPCLVDD